MVFGVFDFIRLVNDKVTPTPTTGTYHEPAVTALTVGRGVAGVLLSIGLVAAATRVEDSTTAKVITGSLTLSVLTAVAGLWLPFVHTNEVDIASTGFRQPYYSISREQRMTIYNATSSPMTICVGTRSHCSASPFAPEQFNGAGLQLAPGEAVDVGVSGR
jgi:cytochrome bd-type quinol oxidase subunit 2